MSSAEFERSALAALYSDPDFVFPEGDRVEFYLTYDGQLKGDGGADHIMDIRKVFHPQLRKFWADHPLLKGWIYPPKPTGLVRDAAVVPPSMKDHLADEFACNGYKFVPLAMVKYHALVTLDILFLRSGVPGTILKSADLDARLKALIDALRIPNQKQELGSYLPPTVNEDPFFCLMEDDKLVSNMSIRTDSLLQATAPKGVFYKHDARVFIKVTVGTYEPATMYMPFT